VVQTFMLDRLRTLTGLAKVRVQETSFNRVRPGRAVKRFDKQKNSKIKTSQIAIQAWKADTSWEASAFLCVGPPGLWESSAEFRGLTALSLPTFEDPCVLATQVNTFFN
jgi:hypothetical protein